MYFKNWMSEEKIYRTNTFIYNMSITYLLLRKINTQKEPDRKNNNAIIKYKAGRGISPADKKLPSLFSLILI